MRRVIAIAICLFILGTASAYAEKMPDMEGVEDVLVEEVIDAEAISSGSTHAILEWNVLPEHEYDIYVKHGPFYVTDKKVMSDTEGIMECRVDGLRSARINSIRITDETTGKNAVLKVAAGPEKVKDVKAAGKNVTYSEAKRASGYQICYSGEKSFKDCKKLTSRSTSAELEGLEKERTYYVKVRAYYGYGGKKYYGSFSETVKFQYMGMEVIDGVTYYDGIPIVNKTYSLPPSYGDGLKQDTVASFERMKNDAAAQGINLWIASGYRSYYEQQSLYGSYYGTYGAYADTFSAKAGHSEHQTGYALDINRVDDGFSDTPEAQWLKDNCHRYGFILRYPDGKQDVTGYKYESWHIRYVGDELAEKLYNDGDWITLEEHFGITSSYEQNGEQ